VGRSSETDTVGSLGAPSWNVSFPSAVVSVAKLWDGCATAVDAFCVSTAALLCPAISVHGYNKMRVYVA